MKKRKCEKCGCTEGRACAGGCGWDPVYLAKGRWICTKCTKRENNPEYDRGFNDGCFLAIQHIVVHFGEDTIAEEFAGACGFSRSDLLRMSRRTGVFVRKTNKAIRGMIHLDE